jgi:hypothetical protein
MLRQQWRLPVLRLLVGFYSSADAAILCANASGAVFVRSTTCRAGETQLDPVALGLSGPAGAPGADGADGVSGWEIVRVEGNAAAPGQVSQARARCPAGKRVVGGGFTTIQDLGRVVTASPNEDSPGIWAFVVLAVNDGPGGSVTVIARAICATVLDETA